MSGTCGDGHEAVALDIVLVIVKDHSLLIYNYDRNFWGCHQSKVSLISLILFLMKILGMTRDHPSFVNYEDFYQEHARVKKFIFLSIYYRF